MDKYIVINKNTLKKNNKMDKKIDKISINMLKKIKIYDVFTDGSCLNNDKNAINSSGGIGVFWDDNNPLNLSEPFNIFPITNNRAELFAIIRAIESFKLFKFKKKYKYTLNIYTDSKLTINIMNNWLKGWKYNNWLKSDNTEPKNLDLIIRLDKLIQKNKKKFNISFYHVRAHRRKPKNIDSQEYYLWHGNNEADKLAKYASNKLL
jgi:ribonuclease HI